MLFSLLNAIRRANASMRQAKNPVKRRQEAERLVHLLDLLACHERSDRRRPRAVRLRRHTTQPRQGVPKPPHR